MVATKIICMLIVDVVQGRFNKNYFLYQFIFAIYDTLIHMLIHTHISLMQESMFQQLATKFTLRTKIIHKSRLISKELLLEMVWWIL